MNKQQKEEILNKAKSFFRDTIITNHIKNTVKCQKPQNVTFNPFLDMYLANYLCGDSKPESIAKAIIYPRVLGTSIKTSFGSNFQNFCHEVLEAFASTTSGIDIEFDDQIDGRKKYCQIKSGPQTINKDDVKTICDHFNGVKKLARTNGLSLQTTDMIVGVFYGTPEELSGNYKAIDKDFPVYIGKEFWHRLTGDENFYEDLYTAVSEVAQEADCRQILNETIKKLAKHFQ